MSGVRTLSRSSRFQLMLIGGALALAFLAGAAKASAEPLSTSGFSAQDGTIVATPDDGGMSHTDPYGKG